MIISRRVTSIVLIASMLLAGCVRTREYKVARYEPGAAALAQPVPRDGVYLVSWKVRERYKPVDDTARYLTKGTAVGFETAPDGNVVAILGDERLVVGEPLRKASYCCWYQKTEEPSQFAIEVTEALAVTGLGAGFVGLIVLDAALDDDDDDDDRDRLRRRDHVRHWSEPQQGFPR